VVLPISWRSIWWMRIVMLLVPAMVIVLALLMVRVLILALALVLVLALALALVLAQKGNVSHSCIYGLYCRLNILVLTAASGMSRLGKGLCLYWFVNLLVPLVGGLRLGRPWNLAHNATTLRNAFFDECLPFVWKLWHVCWDDVLNFSCWWFWHLLFGDVNACFTFVDHLCLTMFAFVRGVVFTFFWQCLHVFDDLVIDVFYVCLPLVFNDFYS
jgi:hypothetical protein